MKKSLIAVAALLAAGAASAQSSVTIYGIIDVGVAGIKAKDGARVTGLTQGGNGSASRIGFRGIEDLGGGLKAGFVLEAGVNVDSGSGSTNPSTDNVAGSTVAGALQFGRRATVSLIGNFGEVRLGRDFTPAYLSETGFDPFGNNGIGAAAWYHVNLNGQVRLRASNQVSYILPSLGGVYGQLSYAIAEQNSALGTTPATFQGNPARDDGRTIGGRIGYANGPVDVAIAGNKLTLTSVTGAVPNVVGLSNDRTQANIAGSFDFGVAKLWALYDFQKAENQNAAGAAANGLETKAKGFVLGVTAPVGPGLIKAAYSRVKVENTNVALQPETSKFAVGYDYNFSKRTRLYGTLAHISNKDGAALTFTSGSGGVNGLTAPTPLANRSVNAYEIGLRHTF